MSYDPGLFIDREQELDYLDRLLQHQRSKAVMRIQADKGMGKSWLVTHMGRHCQAKRQVVTAEVDFRNSREMHEVQDTLSLVRLLRRKLDCPAYFAHLNAVINSFTSTGRGAGPDPVVRALNDLAGRIEHYFDLPALARLSRFLGMIWENVPGNTLYEKAYGLACQMHQLGRLAELLDRLRAERGHVDWFGGLEALIGDAPAACAADAEDRLAPLADEGVRGRDLAERRINEAFFACLAALAGEKPVALFFDGCEQAPGEAMLWIRLQLLDRLRTGELPSVCVVLTGRTLPDLSDMDVGRLLVDVELDSFDEQRVGRFLAAHGLEVSPDELAFLVRYSAGGVPGELARLIDNRRARIDCKDPFFDD